MLLSISLRDPELMPTRGHPTDAGLDLRSSASLFIAPGCKAMLDTGVAVKIPPGHVGLVFSRSGQAKYNVSLANAVGVIDSDYRGTIKVVLANYDLSEPFRVTRGDKIAQLVVMPIVLPELEFVSDDNWNDTDRGTGGFGSTGAQ